MAWNLVDGVHDGEPSERTVWVDGTPHHVERLAFADDLSTVGDLRCEPVAVRAHRERLLVLASEYEMPFGRFSGALPVAGRLREGWGVMERHRAPRVDRDWRVDRVRRVELAARVELGEAVQPGLFAEPRRLFVCTPSKLAAYEDCPRRYRFTYVDRPTPPRGHLGAQLARRCSVHTALRAWFDLPHPSGEPAAIPTLLKATWVREGYRDVEQERAAYRLALPGSGSTWRPSPRPTSPSAVERTVGARTATLALPAGSTGSTTSAANW